MPDSEVTSRQRQGNVKRKGCRKAGGSDRNQPPEVGNIDKQRCGNPIKAAQKKAEAEGVTQTEGRPRAIAADIQPEQPRKRDKQQRRQIHRWKRGCRAASQQKSEPIAPPAREVSEAISKATKRGLDPRTGRDAEQQ